jgi:hypothetical protein
VYGKLVEYIRKSQRYAQNYSALRHLFRSVYPFSLTLPTMERYADLR